MRLEPIQNNAQTAWDLDQFARLSTAPIPAILNTQPETLTSQGLTELSIQKQKRKRILTIGIVSLAVIAVLYFTWHPTSSDTNAQPVQQQNFVSSTSNKTSPSTSAANSSGGTIQVYVVGAVRHPGVYKLPANARIYDLLQAAGGPLPDANLVAINLAARLNDGQEIYVLLKGETPPTSVGGSGIADGSTNAGTAGSQPVNINTASTTELRQGLHITSKEAQAIVDYRLQHGPFTSVNQLMSIVSTSVFNRIKNMVTT